MSDVRCARRADHLAVLHDAETIGQIEYVMQIMADQENADAFGLKLLDKLAHLGGFLRSQRRRRLIHDQDAGIEVDSAGDGDRLPLTAGELAHRFLEAAEIRIEPVHHLARRRFHCHIVERAERRFQFAAEIKICGGIDIIG